MAPKCRFTIVYYLNNAIITLVHPLFPFFRGNEKTMVFLFILSFFFPVSLRCTLDHHLREKKLRLMIG